MSNKSPAPALRLKWEPWEHGRRDLYWNAYKVIDPPIFVARAKSTGQWCYAWPGGSTPACIASRLEAQRGAESAAKDDALKFIKKAEALWPGLIAELTQQKKEG